MGARVSAEMTKAKDLIINHKYNAYQAAKETGISRSAISKAAWYREFTKGQDMQLKNARLNEAGQQLVMQQVRDFCGASWESYEDEYQLLEEAATEALLDKRDGTVSCEIRGMFTLNRRPQHIVVDLSYFDLV